MLSFAEPLQLDCPRCGSSFEAQTWVIVDGHERPDLVERILDGSLHNIECGRCGQTGVVPAPLLYHDGQAGRVLLAVPAGMEEIEWRDAGQGLLWMLIGSLPEAQRLPYLGNLQAEAGLEGIAQVIVREKLAGFTPAQDEDVPPIAQAIQALLVAQTPAALQQTVRDHPILNDPQAIAILRELAHTAFQQNDEAAGAGFGRAADILVQLRDLAEQQRQVNQAAQAARPPAGESASPQPQGLVEDPLDELAFAVMRTNSGAELAAVVDQYPELLDEGSDALLEQWAIQARLTGKPRIAAGMDERRQALRDMRSAYQSQRPILEAVQLLLDADSAEAVEEVIVEYGELLTPEADDMLARLSEGAEEEVAALIAERRSLLQQVRGLMNADE